MTVSEQIIQVINALCEKFGIAINWTSENVLPYVELLCRKLVTYEIWTSIAWTIFAIVMIVASVMFYKKMKVIYNKKSKEATFSWETSDWEIGFILSIGAVIVSAIIGSLMIACQILDIIKCLTFPEMYVFEYVSRLIQQ
jgi:hypothetical protein